MKMHETYNEHAKLLVLTVCDADIAGTAPACELVHILCRHNPLTWAYVLKWYNPG